MIFSATITRVRAGTKTDRAGDTMPDWEASTRLDYHGVSMQPRIEQETVQTDRDLSVSSWWLSSQIHQDIDLLATDRVEFAGMTLEVVGDVGRWPHPDGGVHHIEATLKVWGT